MITAEQLSAYLAGELDADERREVDAALERDPELRARLQRLEEAEAALRSLPDVTPREGFSDRLHATLDRELADVSPGDEVAQRRSRRFEAFRPLAVAAAAAAVIALFGVAGVWLLQGGAADTGGEAALAPMEAGGEGQGARVPIAETDNNFDEQELRRLAVNVEVRDLVPPELTSAAATPLADELQDELLSTSAASDGEGGAVPESDAAGQDGGAADTANSRQATAGPEVVAECLPTVLQDARSALIPVYVELARFDGEPAVIYTLVAEDPESGTYRRVEVWALARSDCQVLSFAQYDRE